MFIFVTTLAVYFKNDCIIMVSPYCWNSFLEQNINAFVRVRPIINNISEANGSIMRSFQNSLEGLIVCMNICDQQEFHDFSFLSKVYLSFDGFIVPNIIIPKYVHKSGSLAKSEKPFTITKVNHFH